MTQLKEKVRPAGRGKLAVEYVAIDSIRPSKHNTRTHPPEQITQILRSIKEFGWTKPIIVDEKGEILAGHGAYQAAQQDGMVEVPIIRRAGLTAAQKRAYRTADNKIGEDSDWDRALLGAEFEALMNMGYDVTLTGFSQTEVDFILKPPAQATQEPPAPPPGGPAISKQGDLWLLGNHRLLCGDSTKPASYKRLMNGEKAACIFTDPPYGVSYEARGGNFEVIKGDDKRRGQLKDMLQSAFQNAVDHSREDAGWYVWHASSTRDDFAQALRNVGLVENGYIIWAKAGMVLGRSDYQWSHEPCFYAARQGVRPAFHGDRTHTTIWQLERAISGQATAIGDGVIITMPDGQELFVSAKPPKGKKVRHLHIEGDKPLLLQPVTDQDSVWRVSRDTGHGKDAAIHPTMKPVELVRKALINSTTEGQIVLDMFSGSASTIMGAEQTQRCGYAIELDPLYVDASIRRWQNMTGKAATHAEEKTTFDAIASARTAKTA
jgi:DNA modification methylase